ncbi:MAG: response regulator [Chloroflexi bacterium]|nr:response regulator [Chloroflexota bacterium]
MNISLADISNLETQQLGELQSTFLRNVQHELRTPLAIIQGYAELLSEGSLGSLDPDQQQAIFAITHQAHELRTLVERITTLLAVKARSTISIPTNLANIVQKVVEAQQVKIIENGLTLDVHISPGLPLVRGHSDHLKQAIDCLVENALKFTPQGGRVEVRLDSEPGWVYLSITDTGIGIPHNKLTDIFNAFYQVDGSSTRAYGGLGLGLAVAKAVVEAYSGQIEVESQSGRGSRFIVKVPPLSSTTAEINKMSIDMRKQHRILIVDDEEYVALTLKEGLERLPNCEIVTATSGKAALQLCAQKPFDLLFTDYKMPDMDGMALAEQVRQLYPQTVIIMITAHSNRELYDQATGNSIRRILNKPVQFSEIRRVATEALEGSSFDI